MSTPPDTATATDWPAVTVVMPVLNEELHLREAVERVLAQDYAGPLELVMALGPSQDSTDEIARELARKHEGRIRTVDNPSGRTPAGLNAAVAASHHPVVVRVDGHALFAPDYVRTAVEVLRSSGADNVGGIMAAQGVTAFERAVARAMTSVLGVGSAPFHTGGSEGPAETVYLGVFRRETLQRVGGYDESFTRAQDWEMNHRIRNTGGIVWFTPRLRVTYRPRASLRALARQYRDYGRWRRGVMRLHAGTASFRYLAPPVLLAALAGSVAAAALGVRAAWLVPAGYTVAITVGGLAIGAGETPAVRVRIPAALATMHLSWGWGFLTSRIRPDVPAPIHSRVNGSRPCSDATAGPSEGSG